MDIHVKKQVNVDNDLEYIPLINYRSNSIPRKGESLYFAHFGLFIVTDVIYRISDDSQTIGGNSCMWVDIKVEKVK